MAEKRRLIAREFEQYSLTGDRVLNLQTLEQYLQSMNNNSPVEHEIVEELFGRADKQQQGQVTVDEFINVVIEADQILTKKIQQAQNDIASDQLRMEEQRMKLREVQQREQYNQEGIALDSVLNIEVYQAQIRSDVNNSNVLLHLECNGQQYQTQPVNSRQAIQWNKSFQFKIDHRIQNLSLRLIMEDQYNSAGIGTDLAFLEIQLSLLEDQQKRDEWLDMKSAVDGQIGQFKLRLSVQWIHNKVQLLKSQLQDLNQDIQQLQQDIIDNQMNQEAIYGPFKGIHQNNNYGSNMYNNTQQYNTFNNMNTENNVQTQNIRQFLQKDSTYSSKIFTIGLIFLCLISSFARSQYLDLVVAFCVLYTFYCNQIDKHRMTMIMGMFALSFVLDFIWLFNFTSGWWNETKLNFVVIGLRRTVLFFSYVIFFYKVVLLFVFFSFSQKAFRQNGGQYDSYGSMQQQQQQYGVQNTDQRQNQYGYM